VEPEQTDLIIIGGGPGGYAAAFAAADRGLAVVLVDREARLGGVCMNRGCIPSKAYLQTTQLLEETKLAAGRGLDFPAPSIDPAKLRDWKDSVVDQLGKGLAALADQRGVQVVRGRGHFEDASTLRVETSEGQRFFRFGNAILATGSSSALPKAFDLGNPRIMTSREALKLEEIPERLLVVGAGYIGLEMGTVYARLGSQVVVVEALDRILAGADADLVRPVQRAAEQQFAEIRPETKVQKMATDQNQIRVVSKTGDEAEREEHYDRVLVAVGRVPNTRDLGLEHAGIKTDKNGFVEVDDEQRTSADSIYAIGDVVGEPLLAHKATREGRIAIEAITGDTPEAASELVVPAVVFTDPELAWCGLTETQAKDEGRDVIVSRFPWSASGRAVSYQRTDGLTKLLVDPKTERILGVGIAGHGAGELIGEGVLAVEMGATAYDLSASIHPHPTLSETLMECAESFYGAAVHHVSKNRQSD